MADRYKSIRKACVDILVTFERGRDILFKYYTCFERLRDWVFYIIDKEDIDPPFNIIFSTYDDVILKETCKVVTIISERTLDKAEYSKKCMAILDEMEKRINIFYDQAKTFLYLEGEEYAKEKAANPDKLISCFYKNKISDLNDIGSAFDDAIALLRYLLKFYEQ